MNNLIIKPKIDVLLNQNGVNKTVAEVEVIGSGGAFNHEEGGSSFIITYKGKNLLIDCGHSVYSRLCSRDRINDIDYIFISHLHADHVSDLSTLIYYNYFINKKETKIFCNEGIIEDLRVFLNLQGHTPEQYEINGNCSFNCSILVTDNNHVPGYKSSGIMINIPLENDMAHIIFSGDINKPIFELFDFTSYNPLNLFIFHDVTAYDSASNVHCHYSLLKTYKKKYSNLFGYHHSKDDAFVITQNTGIRSLSTIDNKLLIQVKPKALL